MTKLVTRINPELIRAMNDHPHIQDIVMKQMKAVLLDKISAAMEIEASTDELGRLFATVTACVYKPSHMRDAVSILEAIAASGSTGVNDAMRLRGVIAFLLGGHNPKIEANNE